MSPETPARLAFWTRRRVILAAVLVALLLRLWAAWQLPLDADEPVYLKAGFEYAKMIRQGDWNGVIEYPENIEHPALVKLLYAGSMLAQGKTITWSGNLYLSRLISVVFGTLAVLVVALLDPAAGLLLAVQTMIVKYTSEAYLEALPLMAMLLAVFALLRSRRPRDGWFWVSALALGLTAAGKFSYFPIVVVLVYLWFWEKRYPAGQLLLYSGVALLAFFALDPSLWHDPISRLYNALTFHVAYSQGTHVREIGYPWYQPLVWIYRSMPYAWHPDVFFYLGFDGLIAILGTLAIPLAWHQRRWLVVWMAAGVTFLLLWPTRWPQYSLVVLPAFCLSAPLALRFGYAWFKEQDTYWNWLSEMLPRPSRLLLAGFALIIIVLTVGQIGTTIYDAWLRLGWWQLSTENTALPSNLVYRLAADGHQMMLASDQGAMLFTLSPDTKLPEQAELFTSGNSGLPDNRVVAAAAGPDGALWLGTRRGVARYKGGQWQSFRSRELALANAEVHDLEVGPQGQVWVGTSSGLAVFDGRWQTYTPANSSLPEAYISALAVDTQANPGTVWAATAKGIFCFSPSTAQWAPLNRVAGMDFSSISDMMVDHTGRLWVATLGSGLYAWDGQSWRTLRVSNSKIPSNSVQRIVEAAPGQYWVGINMPAAVGGFLAKFDGDQEWEIYRPNNSGFTGSTPLDMAYDADGRLWIATRTDGVLIFQPRQ